MMKINGRNIGPGEPPYIIAEVSANHNGNIQAALDTIAMAKECGADAVKIQSYTPETMTIQSDRDDFKISGGLWDGFQLYDLYKWAQTPFEWHQELFDHARSLNITIFSTPFDETAVQLLEDMNSPAYKVASFEATDLPLIADIARREKPMILSTGMANLQEIVEAVDTIKGCSSADFALLHCISGYPAPINQSNLKTMVDIGRQFNVPVGLSDHSLGVEVSLAAVALGACIIEKHVTIDRKNGSPDAEFSLEPEQLKELTKKTKLVWEALGDVSYERKPVEESSLKFRRSIYVTSDVPKGAIITEKHIRRIRPGYGLAPKYYNQILGRIASRDLESGEAFQWDMIDGKS